MSTAPGEHQPMKVGGFEVVFRLSQGSDGSAVYRARQPELNREVALKVLPSDTISPQDRPLLLAGAQAAAKLEHVHIVRIYSFGEHDGKFFFAMPYIANGSLANRIAERGPLRPDDAAKLVRNVASALMYAREQGVPHPGLNVDSILLDQDDEPRLIGFVRTRLTTKSPSESEDLHSLGAILQACLMGSASVGRVPSRLDSICRKCSSTDSSDQFPSVAAVIARLDDYLAGRSSRRRAKRRLFVVAIGLLAVGGAAVGLWRGFANQRGNEQPSNQHTPSDGVERPSAADAPDSSLPKLSNAAALRPGTPEAERAVAEWVIDCGGKALVRPAGSRFPAVTSFLVAERPSRHLEGDIVLLGVSLSNRPVRDADLANLLLLSGLIELYLDGTLVTDDGVIRHLGGLASLRRLSLERTGITDAAVPYLTKLAETYLRRTKIAPSSIEQMARSNRAMRILHDIPRTSPPEQMPAKYALWFEDGARVEVPLDYRVNLPITIELTMRAEPQLTDHVTILGTLSTDNRVQCGLHLGWRPLPGKVFGFQSSITERTADGTGWSTKWQGTVGSRPPLNGQPMGVVSRVAGVFDGKTLMHFRDGKLEGSVPSTVQLGDGEIGMAILGRHPKPELSYNFLGMIDEIRISSVARYSKDYIPASRLEADEHTLGLYHLDEGKGDVAKDSSGRQNHGKIHGARWIRVD